MKSLEAMTLAELNEVQSTVAALIERRRLEEKGAVLEKLRALAAESGFSLEELVRHGAGRSESRKPKTEDKRATVAPKYRDPVTGTTWTGRGKKPKWVEAALAAGRTLESLGIAG